MDLLEPATYDVVVAEWVKAEHGSPFTDFGEAFNGEEAPIAWALEPDVTDPEQNVVRAGMLALLRPMVGSLPPGTIWNRARASRDDLRGFLYMAGADWAELSGGSRRIGDGARLFTSNCHDEALRSAVHLIRRKVLAGTSFPPLIAISTPALDPIVVIEGHKRATAYLFGRKTAINEVPLIIGRSPNMHQFAHW
jgi:hypothetical protein